MRLVILDHETYYEAIEHARHTVMNHIKMRVPIPSKVCLDRHTTLGGLIS